MYRYHYRDQWLTINELSEMSGVAAHTLRDRLRRGFTIEQAIRPSPIHESIDHFCEASCFNDWIGMSINDLYEIYWKWSVSHGYTTASKQGFSRQLKTIYPQLKTVPTQRGDSCQRIIRLRA